MKAMSTNPERVDRLFSTGEARLDRWYKLALLRAIEDEIAQGVQDEAQRKLPALDYSR